MDNLNTTKVIRDQSEAQPLDGQKTAKRLLALMVIDIVDSMGWLAKLGEMAYAHRKNRLQLWAREVIHRKEIGGREVKRTGDGMLAIFPNAANAVECALTLQEALPKAQQGDFFPIRVGLDMGVIEVVFVGGKVVDINGGAVNRLCRIEPLGGAGHVLVSNVVCDMTQNWLTGLPIKWKDHGRYKLKGLQQRD